MRRIAAGLTAAIAVAASGAAVALAADGADDPTTGTTTSTVSPTATDPKPAPRFSAPARIRARVTAVDSTTKTLTVRLRRHCGPVDRGAVLTIATNDATVFDRLPDGFDSIEVGKAYELRVKRATAGTTLVASRIEPARGNRRDDDSLRSGSDDPADHDAGDDHGGKGGHGGGRDD